MTDLELFVRRLVDRLREKDPAGIHRPLTLKDVRRGLLPYRVHRNALRLTSGEDYDLLLLRLCAEEGGLVRTNPPEAAERCRQEIGSPNPDLSLVAELDDVTVQIGAGALQRIMSLELEAPEPAPDPGPLPSDLPLLPLDAPGPPGAVAPMLDEPILDAPPPEPGPPPKPPEPVPPPWISRPEPIAVEPMPPGEPMPPREPGPPREPEPRGRRSRPEPKPVLRLSRPEPEPPKAAPGPTCPHCHESLPRSRRAVFCPHCGQRVDPLRCSRCGTELEPGWRHCITCGRPTTSDGAYV